MCGGLHNYRTKPDYTADAWLSLVVAKRGNSELGLPLRKRLPIGDLALLAVLPVADGEKSGLC